MCSIGSWTVFIFLWGIVLLKSYKREGYQWHLICHLMYYPLITKTFICWIDIAQQTNNKDTTESSISASYLDILLNRDINDKLNTQLYDKYDNFNFSIINFRYLCSNMHVSSSYVYGVYLSQLIRYDKTCYAYNHILSQCKLLTNKFL